MPESTQSLSEGFVDRRTPSGDSYVPSVERRQFSNNHDGLSPRAKELAVAIDEYKLRHRRRFITFEEILGVIDSLGYSKDNTASPSLVS